MARINKQDQDIVGTADARPQRSENEDVEGHAKMNRNPTAEIEQGNDFRANKPTDDDDVEGHSLRMRHPESESVRNRIN